MNVIIESILKNHMEEYELNNDKPKAFEHLINYIVMRNFTSRHFDPNEIATGKGEVGIDGIAIVVNDCIVTTLDEAKGIFDKPKAKNINVEFVFTQSKTSESFSGSDMTLFSTSVRNFFNRKSRIVMNEKITELGRITDYIFENAYKVSPNPTCYMYYATNGVWKNEHVLSTIINCAKTDMMNTQLFSTVEFFPYDLQKIAATYREIKNSLKRQIIMEQSAPFPVIPEIEEAYIGIVKCEDFVSLITDLEGKLLVSLFEDNVRYFQGNNVVNLEMAETINSEAQQRNFPLLNNGVTIVAKEIRRTGNQFTLTDFQIVNGCQTSFVLFENRNSLKDDAYIVIKVVATKNEDLTGSIVRATNRQTPVQTEAFETLRTFHKNLEVAYRSYNEPYRLYYERRSKQYDSDNINKNKVVSFSMQISSYLAMFLAEPQSTHRYYGELLTNNRKRLFHDEDVLQQYCISSIYLFYVEKWLKDHSPHDKNYRIFKYHFILLLRCFVSNKPLPKQNSYDMEKLCKILFDVLLDDSLMNSYMIKASEIIDLTRDSLLSQGASEVNLPRSKEFTNEMLDRLSLSVDNVTIGENKKELTPNETYDCEVIYCGINYVNVIITGYQEKGRVNISELANFFVHDVDEVVSEGMKVRAKLLDKEKNDKYGYLLSIKSADKD